MKLGIIGLPQSGKTTIFNALTGGSKPVGHMAGGGRFEVNHAVVNVPDERVGKLSAMFNPKKTIYAQVTYADIAGLEEGAGKSGFSGPLLNQLAQMDGFIHVVRAFENPNVPHPSGSVNPSRDVNSVETDLLLQDLVAVERKLERVNDELRKGGVKDKTAAQRELALFQRLHETLSAETPLREMGLPHEDEKTLSSYAFLTRKPLLTVLNIDDETKDEPTLPGYHRPHTGVVALRGRLEMEIAQLSAEDAAAFLADYGISEPSLRRMIRLSYDLLGLQSFFTVGEDEVRAWTVKRGAAAPDAAGEIHTDLREGFIRAEVFGYDDLMSAGSVAEVKHHGKFRLEGKEYVVKDGDILNIRFSPPAKK
ncbi:MAG: redox-regulated ATPase YchF [Chloroflexi bacterium]|nr:redox-regulated ATPase YchF [Chloroflexota bacterium]